MRIACILGNRFEDSEFRIPRDRLTAAGHEVVVVGQTKGQIIEGKNHKEKVTAHQGIDDVKVDQFDGLLIPGGYSPDQLRRDERFVGFARAFDKANKPIFAVCHGPQLMITADIVRGRTLTSWPTVMAELKNAGANVVDRQVVVDRNFITSRGPDDLEAFSQEIINYLGAGAGAHP
ncbi:MAG: type 1 glutamine amidotransferase domain-containing protein [Myxococcales bacterium]|jgi:protease I